ncbi:MAG: rRNA maturation RNase YbeY [Clostridiales bacterium]|nr:rRNA maturation RNase YbeY [Clostridiales bacterium]
MKLRIDFSNDQDKKKAGLSLRRLIKKAVRGALVCEQFERDAMVSVTFTDNEGIREKNRQFRGIDAPTDVLSFPMYDWKHGDMPAPGEICELGDIVLSLERAAEQAEEFGHSYERECAFLTVHSILHLLGYDHVDSEEDEREMRARQRIIMKHIGLEVKQKEEEGEE